MVEHFHQYDFFLKKILQVILNSDLVSQINGNLFIINPSIIMRKLVSQKKRLRISKIIFEVIILRYYVIISGDYLNILR